MPSSSLGSSAIRPALGGRNNSRIEIKINEIRNGKNDRADKLLRVHRDADLAIISVHELPDQTIPSIAISLTHRSLSAQKLVDGLRTAQPPIVGRVKDDQVLLDMRGADPMEELIQALQNVELGAK